MPADTLIDYVPGMRIEGDDFPAEFQAELLTDMDAVLQSLGDDGLVNGMHVAGDGCIQQSLSEADCSATYVIVTDKVNRWGYKHRISQSKHGGGILADYWSRAPIVLFEHGKNPAYTMPIGLAEKDGRLALRVSQSQMQSTCYFNQHAAVPMDIFRLASSGILRMASITVDPTKPPVRISRLNQNVLSHAGRPPVGVEFVESQMVEWSVCSTGVDPGAVRQCLSSGSVGGERIHQHTRRILEPYSEEKPAVGIGFDFARLEAITERLEQSITKFAERAATPAAVIPPAEQPESPPPQASPGTMILNAEDVPPVIQQSMTDCMQGFENAIRKGLAARGVDIKVVHQSVDRALGKVK